MWTRKELKEKAKERFKANYWICVLVALILAVLTGGVSGSTGDLNSDFDEKHLSQIEKIVNSKTNTIDAETTQFHDDLDSFLEETGFTITSIVVFSVTITIFIIIAALALTIYVFNPLYVGCRRFFVKNLTSKAELNEVGYMFGDNYKRTVNTMFFKGLYIFLWSLLLIIPGIIKSYEYRMVPYLIAMNPEMETKEVFARSKEMMNGNKWNAFVLDVSFVGWVLLSGLTIGLLGVFYVNPYIYQTDACLYEKLGGNVISSNSEVIGEYKEM